MCRLFICSVCSDLGAQEGHRIYACSPSGVVKTQCLHNLHRKRGVYETREEILPLRKWEGVLLSVQPGQVLRAAAGCLRSRPPQLARVTSVEVLTERLLLTGAYSRKHLNAFLKLITCFPELGLECCKGLNLTQRWRSAVAWPWAARGVEMLLFAPTRAHTGCAAGEGHHFTERSKAPSTLCSSTGPLSPSPACLLPVPTSEEPKPYLAALRTPVH